MKKTVSSQISPDIIRALKISMENRSNSRLSVRPVQEICIILKKFGCDDNSIIATVLTFIKFGREYSLLKVYTDFYEWVGKIFDEMWNLWAPRGIYYPSKKLSSTSKEVRVILAGYLLENLFYHKRLATASQTPFPPVKLKEIHNFMAEMNLVHPIVDELKYFCDKIEVSVA